MIRPIFDNVIIKEDKQPDMSGRIIIPEGSRPVVTIGRVLAAGPGHVSKRGVFIPNGIKAGAKVAYAEHSGTYVYENHEQFLCMAGRDVLAVVGAA